MQREQSIPREKEKKTGVKWTMQITREPDEREGNEVIEKGGE